MVIYEALPNELPRVAGIITTVPQTALSHVNLRAVQDRVPNAFIGDALDNSDIDDLIGSYVHYTVTEDGWTLRAATPAEANAHYAASRPATEQTPQRDLSITAITPLSEVGFDDWTAFGVKAANVAVLQTLGFPDGTVPDGFAIPFYFYDEFMKHNGFYDDVKEMLADPAFQSDFDRQASELKKLRKAIKKGETPQWIIDALTAMHATFPEGQSLRYRSSTNNEDLPGFNGAGLYDSKTQHPGETEEDGIAKITQAGVCQHVELPGLHRARVPPHRSPGGGDGSAGAPQLFRRAGQRRGRQLRPDLRHRRHVLRQHAGGRGPGHQSGGAFGAGRTPAVGSGRLPRPRDLKPGTARATPDD